MSGHPLRHRLAVMLESAEFAELDTRLADPTLRNRTGRDLRLMNVQPVEPLVQFASSIRRSVPVELPTGWGGNGACPKQPAGLPLRPL